VIPDVYVWPVWSVVFLLPWAGLFIAFPRHRRRMIWASVFTAPFGATEPLFVPSYWDPPSLFGLAQRTRFDLESFVFSFALGGVAAVLYNIATRIDSRQIPKDERDSHRHRFHYLAVAAPFVTFPILYAIPWNPIYAGIGAMLAGAVTTVACRPDLTRKTLIGGGLFLAYYAVLFLGIQLTAPGYVERVWKVADLSGLGVAGIPIEELLFACGFGMYWSSVYEHYGWHRLVHRPASSKMA